MTSSNSMDRSAASAALLDLYPEKFGELELGQAGDVISGFLDDFRASGEVSMYTYARDYWHGLGPEAGPDDGSVPRMAEGGDWERATEHQRRMAVAAHGELRRRPRIEPGFPADRPQHPRSCPAHDTSPMQPYTCTCVSGEHQDAEPDPDPPTRSVPHHNRDDGRWCRWSAVTLKPDATTCPSQCAEATGALAAEDAVAPIDAAAAEPDHGGRERFTITHPVLEDDPQRPAERARHDREAQ
jgi:hypothetical protein